jgi:AcrR family transcriptional regulator
MMFREIPWIADMPREYRKLKRAEKEAATRLRIVEAAVGLHEAVGAEGATVTAIAERAGVGRVTLYRHFPDERSLFQACTGHDFAQPPPPEPDPWAALTDGEERARTALTELYAFYRRTEKMLWRAEHDAAAYPALGELMQPFLRYLDAIRDLLLSAREDAADPRPRAIAGHVLRFSTWYSLAREQSLGDADIVDLMAGLLARTCGAEALAGTPARPRSDQL